MAGLHGQARNANWVFSGGMWMQFTDSSMAMLPSPYSSVGPSSCISDTSGQFQMLVDNSGIRGAQFNLLPGASAAELGWDTAGANYLILPKPGAPTRYCILVNEKRPNARAGYVEVDLAANGGAGGVAPPGTTWYMEHTTDKLTATTDSAESGYWVVQHADSGDVFHSFHVTNLGLDPVPVVSHAGHSYLADTPGYINADRIRPMKFSVQGDKLAAVIMGSDLDTNALELFHFNRASGSFNFWTRLTLDLYALDNTTGQLVPNDVGPRKFVTDCEFSADGNYLYYQGADTFPYNGYSIVAQVSLVDTAAARIAQSAFGVMGTGVAYAARMYPEGAFLLVGLNGRLYARPYDPYPNILLDLFALPTAMDSLSGPDHDPMFDVGFPLSLTYATYAGYFPNICKRYVDSSPITTGMHPMDVNATLRVWPNPGSGLITVQLGGVASAAVARFTDATGRAVPGIWHLHPGDNTMDISGLADGIYMLHVQSGDEVRHVRIVKQ
ncbi:MAG: T9SS type A sorting domain-containing protein [Bacteroidetes bacterium]|nr:T9SS type A sorting domain-containing protein [Bacteroidota bacterium]MBS1940335.1 T9SS type A sorting domain-containing protein [Bacteroidota bacterium]